jgi:hypothetical protein
MVIPAAALLAVTGVIASAGAASAGTTLTITYKVTGSTLIKSVNANTPLGPGKLVTKANLNTGKLTANLSLPPATVSFKEYGLPVVATANLVQDGPTTGQININTGAVKTTSRISLQLTSLTIAGLTLTMPATCESATPAVIKLASQKGFNVVKGGNLAGTYTIPPVANCGLLTPVLNLIFPGPGNTITLKLGAAKTG